MKGCDARPRAARDTTPISSPGSCAYGTHTQQRHRPAWPRRAVVTAGMPYGNKNLHFGHVGGVFIPADFFARFLRDRIGAENVLFVSGTDCYGSPIMESYRKLHDEQGYQKRISDYVQENHDRQAATLAGYDVAPDFFGGSALEPAAHVHEQVTDEILMRLQEHGVLQKRSTLQFYDPKAGQFLNGRQVLGRCPIQGCKSEKAYADECDLGHQFEPEELIAPVSALTGETPELRPVENLYFDLPAYLDYLRSYTSGLEGDETVRSVVVKTMEEWLGEPQLYIQMKFREAFDAVEDELPAHTVTEPEGGKGSFTVTFRAGASATRPTPSSRRAGCASARARRSCRSASRATSSGACPCPAPAAARDSPAGSGPRACGRPSASRGRRSPRMRRTAPTATPRTTGATGGARPRRTSTSSSVRTISTSTASPRRRCGGARLRHAAVDARGQLPRALHGQEGELIEQDSAAAGIRAPRALRRRAAARAFPLARAGREAGLVLAQGLRHA